MTPSADLTLRFAGRFELQSRERRLLVDGSPAKLGARAFDLLRVLAERPDQLVSKRELMDLVWPDVVVEENNIQQQVCALRKLLGSNVIATIPGVGYRFVTEVDIERSSRPSTALSGTGATASELKTNLPKALPALIGRETDRAALARLVDEHRLVTVTGAGGIGKSRLAQALLFDRRDAHRHGVCLVDLSPTINAAAVPGIIGSAVGVPDGQGDPLQALIDMLTPLELLLALDNAEHLVDAVATVTEALHRAAPNVRLLITSQVSLRIIGEHVYRLGPLGLPEHAPNAAEARNYGALALFSERARAVDLGFAITDENVTTVAQICRQLDGVPLPIELAAARVPLLGLPRLAASLDQRLRLLSTGSPTAPPRQQTLLAALEWSHALLGEAEQKVFRRLAVFVGSASLEAAQHVAADGERDSGLDEWDVLDALGALVDRSLVAVVGGEGAEQPRYRLLDTPRAFALEQLRASEEEEAVRQRHAAAMRSRFESALDERYRGSIGIDEWQHALESDCDNGFTAVQWAAARGDRATALAIAPALHQAMCRSSRHSRCAALWRSIERFLDASDVAMSAAEPRGQAVSAYGHFLAVSQPALAILWARQAVQLLRTTSDRVALYVAYDRVCWPSVGTGQMAEAIAALEAMRSLEETSWAPALRMYRAECEFLVRLAAQDFDGARHWASRQAELEQAAGWSHGLAQSNVVCAAVAAGRAAEVLDDARAIVARLAPSRDRRTLAFARLNLVAALLAENATSEAHQVAKDGWGEVGLFGLHSWWAGHLALLAARESRPFAAARLAGYADAVHATTGHQGDLLLARSVKRAVQLAREALGDDLVREQRAQGAALTAGDISELAFDEAERRAPARHQMAKPNASVAHQ